MSKRKAPPIVIPDDLTPHQRGMIEGASSDAARVVLLSLFAKARPLID